MIHLQELPESSDSPKLPASDSAKSQKLPKNVGTDFQKEPESELRVITLFSTT